MNKMKPIIATSITFSIGYIIGHGSVDYSQLGASLAIAWVLYAYFI